MQVRPLPDSQRVAPFAAARVQDRLLRLKEVQQIVGLGKTFIYRLIGSGQFPAPYKPAENVARWSENEVNAWLATCAAKRFQ
jgi:prophage regulatory protein